MNEPGTQQYEAPHERRVREVELVVLVGPDQGRRYRTMGTVARVGTGPSNHLRLTDPTVSRIHCQIESYPSGVRVTDAGSTNGTILNGVRLRDAELPGPERLRLGGTIVEIRFGEPVVSLPLSPRERLEELVGASPEMRRVYALIERAAPTETTVLVEGETGTGKELVARAIHRLSPRRDKPFVAVDCGSIAATLIETELFGHVRGAFSGAANDRRGLFEDASTGTVFLDEVGELPLPLQSKLLRALETREIRRVGENTSRRIDVRFVAATNRPMLESVNQGTFREDLYYRLAVVEVNLPPLRARREDIPILARHFFRGLRGEGAEVPGELLSAIQSRSWPGNVRELRNYVERAVSLGWYEAGSASSVPAPPSGPAHLGRSLEEVLRVDLPLREARAAWVDGLESMYMRELLRRTGGNVTRAAELAQVNRRHFQRTLARLGIRAADNGGADD